MLSALIAVSMFALSASGTEESTPAKETKDQPAAAAQAKAKSPEELKEYYKYRWKLVTGLTEPMYQEKSLCPAIIASYANLRDIITTSCFY